MSIYYFIASLPMLTFGMKPPVSFPDFLQDCQRLLSKDEYTIVRESLESDDGPAAYPTVRAWRDFVRDLRNELVVARAERLKRDAAPMLRGDRNPGPRFSEIIDQAVKAPDPMAAEKILDTARWQFLEDLAAGHFFDLTLVIIYGLKIKLLYRYQEMGPLAGQEKYQQVEHLAVADRVG